MTSIFPVRMFGGAGSDAQDARDSRQRLGVRILSDVAVIVGIILLAAAIGWLVPRINTSIGSKGYPTSVSTDLRLLPYYAGRSAFRMFVALIISVVFSYVYALIAARSRRARTILIPFLDILQSVPILGFLSATVTIWLSLFPGSFMGVEAASIFAIFTSQAWNITFSVYQSLITEPSDLDEVARSFRLTRWQRFWKLDVPNSVIPLLWNCMMSVGGGWFFLVQSEAMTANGNTYAIAGIGSFVAAASDQEDMGKIGWAILVMIVMIIVIDVLLWKPLTAWGEKFRVTQSESVEPKKSVVLSILRHSGITDWLARACRPIADFFDAITRPLGRTGARWPQTACVRRNVGDVIFGVLYAILGIWCLVNIYQAVTQTIGWGEIGYVFGLGWITFGRVLLLTVISTLIWVPLGSMIGMNAKLTRFLQPVVQVLASFPTNFTFPFFTMWYLAWHIDMGWGSILLMSLGTQWYILFNVIAGASAIPDDLREVSRGFRLTRWQKWRSLILPAIFGSWCTGAITAVGGAWNASIVSEIVTYGNIKLQTIGLGSYNSIFSDKGDMPRQIASVAVMSLFVVVINRFFWRPMQDLAKRRFSLE